MSGLRLVLALLVCAALLPGCGRKGPPLAPRAVVPSAVTELGAETQPEGIVLSWTRPWRNSDGSGLGELAEFRIWRTAASPSATAAPAWGAAPLATVAADRPANAVVQGGRYSYWDEAGLETGMRYRYRIQAIGRGGVPGLVSPETTVDFLPPPPPPTGVTARVDRGAILLAWQPPPLAAGRRLDGYNVYRRAGSGPYGRQPVNGQPLTAPEFRDAGLAAETTYTYSIRSVDAGQQPWKEGPRSAEVSATIEDLVPPAPPRGVVAVPGEGSVGLTWAANVEPDILGYLVYRREAESSTPVRLTESPILATTYTDRTPKPGVAYLYTVTAVDRSARRNESAPSAEVPAATPK